MDIASEAVVERIREASRKLVREWGFLKPTLAATHLAPSTVHALVELAAEEGLTAGRLAGILNLEKSSVSRMVRKLVEEGLVAEAVSDLDGRAKRLTLTERGRRLLAAVDSFARAQVCGAIERLPPAQHRMVVGGLAAYADALEASRIGQLPIPRADPVEVRRGYAPGMVGRVTEMHARYYGRAAGFGQFFESQVAKGVAEFVGRLDDPRNGFWAAVRAGTVVGSIAIDGGGDGGGGPAHLRWFIVDESARGCGLGKRLLSEAVAFCDREGFPQTELWTFRGLDAARRLYEASGFALVEETAGDRWGKRVVEQRFVRGRPGSR